MSDHCPVARQPTIHDLAFGHFRAKDGVWNWIPPIRVVGYMELLPPQMPSARLLAKAVFCLAVLLPGCGSPPAPPDLRAQIATSGMLALMLPSPAPLPPAPTPGAKCENCRGTGIVGDSVVGKTCPVCKGSGVTPAEAPPSSSGDWVPARPVRPVVSPVGEPARFAAPAPVVSPVEGPTFRIVCEDGQCRRVQIAPQR